MNLFFENIDEVEEEELAQLYIDMQYDYSGIEEGHYKLFLMELAESYTAEQLEILDEVILPITRGDLHASEALKVTKEGVRKSIGEFFGNLMRKFDGFLDNTQNWAQGVASKLKLMVAEYKKNRNSVWTNPNMKLKIPTDKLVDYIKTLDKGYEECLPKLTSILVDLDKNPWATEQVKEFDNVISEVGKLTQVATKEMETSSTVGPDTEASSVCSKHIEAYYRVEYQLDTLKGVRSKLKNNRFLRLSTATASGAATAFFTGVWGVVPLIVLQRGTGAISTIVRAISKFIKGYCTILAQSMKVINNLKDIG